MNWWDEAEAADDAEGLSRQSTEYLLKLQAWLNRRSEIVERLLRQRRPGMARHNAEMDLRSMSDEKRAAMDAEIDRALKGLPPSPAPVPAAKKPARPRKGDK